MRISTITNWAYGITVALTAISAAAFMLSADAATRERRAVAEHLELDDLGEELALGAEERSDAARLYVMRGSQAQFDAFRIDEGEELRRETAIKDIRSLEPSEAELAALAAIETAAAALDEVEEKAVASYTEGDRAGAQASVFGEDHDRYQTTLLDSVKRFRDLTTARTTATLAAAKDRYDLYSLIAKIMLTLTAIVFIAVLYFVLSRRVAIPLIRMTGVVKRLARQDYAIELPKDGRRDEIGEMNEAIQIFRTNSLERDRLDAERRKDQLTKDLILQLMHRLQGCQSQDELADAVARFVPEVFPGVPGHLYILNGARSALGLAGTWLEPRQNNHRFQSDQCWGLRRGRPHISNRHSVDIPCQHLDGEHIVSLCVPLTAQGDAVGLLYFEEGEGVELMSDSSRLYLELMAENIGLAIANLQLRDRLTNLAQKDGLTGLWNRRSLDEDLNRIGSAPAREDMACLMIDIDHFKRFNDDFGHEVGDIVMQLAAQIMLDLVEDKGKVFRYGGEEFAVLLPHGTLDEAYETGEAIRTKIAETPLSYRGRVLGSITVSIGAAASNRSASFTGLIQRADTALLAAKSGGRNRTFKTGAGPGPSKAIGLA